MGGEFAQFREWNENRGQDFDMLHYPIHDAFYKYIRELNHIYLNNPALWDDYDEDSFKWIDCHLEKKCVYSFLRKSKEQTLIAVFNFSDKISDYEMEIEGAQELVTLLDTDEQKYGGNSIPLKSITGENGKFILSIPPFSGRLYEKSHSEQKKRW